MKYCCEYAYHCPSRAAVACYTHGGTDPCCEDEQAHACLRDMYGGEDGLTYGDGFMCLRCGNHELVGLAHSPAVKSGYPRRQGPPRTGWFDLPGLPGEPEPVWFVVDAVFDIPGRGGLLATGRLTTGVVEAGTRLQAPDGRLVRVLGVELGGKPGTVTLIVDREDAGSVSAQSVLQG